MLLQQHTTVLHTVPANTGVNRIFRFPDRGKSRPGMVPTGLPAEREHMLKLNLLPRILVKIGVKVKITIVRK